MIAFLSLIEKLSDSINWDYINAIFILVSWNKKKIKHDIKQMEITFLPWIEKLSDKVIWDIL